MNFMAFLQEHLSHVLPVLLAGAFAVAIVLERSRALFIQYPMKNAKEFFNKVSELVLAGKTKEAMSLCDAQGDKPVAQVMKTALSRSHLPMEAVEQGLQLAMSDLSASVQKRTPYLATIANVSTLMGLFGTISGLIFSFEAVGHADPQQKSALLSAGIATAMNATMLGLAVAIPSMIAFAVLISKSNKILSEMEESASRGVDVLKLRFYAADMETGEVGFENNRGNTTGTPAAVTPLRRAS